jgi:hypothetical protein
MLPPRTTLLNSIECNSRLSDVVKDIISEQIVVVAQNALSSRLRRLSNHSIQPACAMRLCLYQYQCTLVNLQIGDSYPFEHLNNFVILSHLNHITEQLPGQLLCSILITFKELITMYSKLIICYIGSLLISTVFNNCRNSM